MEKSIKIDGQSVRLKSTGATALRYKAQFKRDFFADIMRLDALNKGKGKKTSIADLADVDFDVIYHMIWILAKTANKEIPEPIEWLDGFDEFPLMEILEDVQDLLASSMGSSKPKKK